MLLVCSWSASAISVIQLKCQQIIILVRNGGENGCNKEQTMRKQLNSSSSRKERQLEIKGEYEKRGTDAKHTYLRTPDKLSQI